jgi:hypothetical protein
VGCYGGAAETPNMDALARSGVRFDVGYSHIPITGPSHSTMFTSRLPSQHGVHNNVQVLGQEHRTLAESLRAWHRETAAFVSLGVLKPEFGVSQGFDTYEARFPRDWWKDASEVNDKVLEWLETSPRTPFFLWVHYSDPHEPYAPPGLGYPVVSVRRGAFRLALVEADGRTVEVPIPLSPGRHEIVLEKRWPGERVLRFDGLRVLGDGCSIELGKGWEERELPGGPSRLLTALPATVVLTSSDGGTVEARLRFRVQERLNLPQIRERYAREVEFVDEELGRLLAALDARGLRESTLVILVSDHGEGLGDHGIIGHCDQLYDSLLRVPLILSWPGRLPAGAVVTEPARLVDLYPTVLDLLGLPVPAGLEGVSLGAWLHGTPPRLVTVAETFRPEASADLQAIVTDGLKYIVNRSAGNAEELYDLREDPGELRDLSEDARKITARLREQLERVLAELARAGTSEVREAQITEEQRDSLRALGYLD